MTGDEKKLYIRSKLKKAEALINEVANHIHFGYLETSINRSYYCCFYCAQALLTTLDIYPKTHKGVISMFNLHFGNTNIFPTELADFLPKLFAQRQLADYGEIKDISKVMVEDFFENTKLFVEKTKEVLQQA